MCAVKVIVYKTMYIQSVKPASAHVIKPDIILEQ